MQKPVDRDVEGVADGSGDDVGAGRRGNISAHRLAGLAGLLDDGDAGDRIADRAIAGAAAEIALQGDRQVLFLFRRQAARRQDHPGGAEATLEARCVEEGALHRMQVARRGEALDRRDAAALCAERRDEAAVDRGSVEQHGAGAAITGVATLLDPKKSGIAQERAQTLPRARHLRDFPAVDQEGHGAAPVASSRRISSARCIVMCRRQSGRPCGSS